MLTGTATVDIGHRHCCRCIPPPCLHLSVVQPCRDVTHFLGTALTAVDDTSSPCLQFVFGAIVQYVVLPLVRSIPYRLCDSH